MLHPDARISTTHETEDPVLPRGTLDRFLLRTEQTGWAVLYKPEEVKKNNDRERG
jgi:hypothetical protein